MVSLRPVSVLCCQLWCQYVSRFREHLAPWSALIFWLSWVSRPGAMIAMKSHTCRLLLLPPPSEWELEGSASCGQESLTAELGLERQDPRNLNRKWPSSCRTALRWGGCPGRPWRGRAGRIRAPSRPFPELPCPIFEDTQEQGW